MDNTKGKKIFKNYSYNVIYQIFLLIVPLITTPYVSRVLSPEGIGAYSYSLSWITYFTLFAGLGVTMYAQREIAKRQGDVLSQSKLFWEIFILRFLSTLLCIAINLIVFLTGAYGKYSIMMLVLTTNILSVSFDISFLFQGNEHFASVAIRNAIIKVLSLIAIFLFVKTKNDLTIYVLINSLSVFLASGSLWFNVHKHIRPTPIKELRPFSHFKAVLLLFLPTIVISIYTVLDKTLIGLILRSDVENGYYEQAERIVKMCVTIITCLGTVMMSRNSAELSKGDIDKVKNNIYFAVKFVWFLGAPLLFGVICVSKSINVWFFGEGYEPVALLMMAFSPIILSLGMNNIFGVQYLIAMKRDKTFTISVIAGALLNLALNLLLIATIGTLGAVISSVLSETAILIIQLIIVRKEFSFRKLLFSGWKNIVGALIMFLMLYFKFGNLSSSIPNTLAIVGFGAFVYIVLMFAFRDELLFRFLRLFSK